VDCYTHKSTYISYSDGESEDGSDGSTDEVMETEECDKYLCHSGGNDDCFLLYHQKYIILLAVLSSFLTQDKLYVIINIKMVVCRQTPCVTLVHGGLAFPY
jgi:hypothetical protein